MDFLRLGRTITAVNALLEWREADTLNGIDEALVVEPLIEISVDQTGHNVGHFGRRK